METKTGRGGKRLNAGRKAVPENEKRKQRSKYLTDYENQNVDEFIEELRDKK